MTETYKGKLASIANVAMRQFFIEIDAPSEVIDAHVFPAQFVRIGPVDHKLVSITIANRPGRDKFEFLVKNQGERSHALTTLSPGDEVELTRPIGPGFPVAQFRHHNLILGCNGVAISAVRGVLEEILLARREYGKVILIYGERSGEHFAFLEEFEILKENGIEILLTASKPSVGPAWMGLTGYVQDILEQIPFDVKGTVAFIVGSNDMMNESRGVLERIGMNPSDIYINY
jgi:NAD(P)H-flavin reductase